MSNAIFFVYFTVVRFAAAVSHCAPLSNCWLTLTNFSIYPTLRIDRVQPDKYDVAFAQIYWNFVGSRCNDRIEARKSAFPRLAMLLLHLSLRQCRKSVGYGVASVTMTLYRIAFSRWLNVTKLASISDVDGSSEINCYWTRGYCSRRVTGWVR